MGFIFRPCDRFRNLQRYTGVWQGNINSPRKQWNFSSFGETRFSWDGVADYLINERRLKFDGLPMAKANFFGTLNVAAEQAAKKMSSPVILSEAKNLSSI
jgi:hypothetical protein